MSKEKLKPCPFCGKQAMIAELKIFIDAFKGNYTEYCILRCCSIMGHIRFYKTKKGLIKAWNKRPK